MKNVVNFPTRPIRDWVLFERTIREEGAKAGIPSEVQTRVIEKLKPFYEALDFDLDLSISVSIGQKLSTASSEQLESFKSKLLVERVQREVDACREIGILL
jgi:hypothetical protein